MIRLRPSTRRCRLACRLLIGLAGAARADTVDARQGIVPGGLGLYRANAVRGPFVHVDARGWSARW